MSQSKPLVGDLDFDLQAAPAGEGDDRAQRPARPVEASSAAHVKRPAAECYRTVVADPPWPFKWGGSAGGARRNSSKLGYETMVYEAITELSLPPVEDNASLLMWVTQDALHTGWAARIAAAWGFPDRAGEWVWNKPNFGMGDFPRTGHETVIVYKRGTGSLKPDRPKDVHSVQRWSQRHVGSGGGKQHSAKPDGFLDLVEQGHEAPYLELFARRARFGWDYFGDQSLETAEVA